MIAPGARPLPLGGRAASDPVPSAPVPVTPEAFRRALGHAPTGVGVVTARAGDRLVGMTVNSFASVSLDPPLVLWSCGRSSASHDAFVAAEGHALHLLGEGDADLARLFASRVEDRFAEVAHAAGLHGAPVIAGIGPVLECRVEARVAGGDHTILVGRVLRLRAAAPGAEPLVYHRGVMRGLGAA